MALANLSLVDVGNIWEYVMLGGYDIYIYIIYIYIYYIYIYIDMIFVNSMVPISDIFSEKTIPACYRAYGCLWFIETPML